MITPMIPATGLIGWKLLQNTITDQRNAFNSSTTIARDTKYFQDKISEISSGEELVEDRALLRVALTAFGLGDEINNTYLLKTVLQEGTQDENSLANRLGDSRYIALADAFNFENIEDTPVKNDGFADEIIEGYRNTILSDLSDLLATDEYVNNPVAAATLRTSALEAMEEKVSYFQSNISEAITADKLLEDKDLLKVALAAFGVEERLNSTSIIKRALLEDPADDNSLVNLIGDSGLAKLSEKFGYYLPGDRKNQNDEFSTNIVESYRWQLFENEVYNIDPSIGTALSFQRGAPALAALEGSDNTKWYSVLGDTMMREVFETALGLPEGFSQIDIDKQLTIIKEKSEDKFGIVSFSDIEDPRNLDKIIRLYLLQNEVQSNNSLGSHQVALTLLSSVNS
ncbi:DUF1217 domain-containing protein [Sagittula sp. SSi028]|uniref:DUF1217 domain-containing protein n=1 Tax=Sagittula sp. SSi028 TaxID=3400636 RepID=UPI003AF5C0A1